LVYSCLEKLKDDQVKKKNLYLLYEIADREFESKSLLAYKAAINGWRVYLLDRNVFINNIAEFYPGAVIYKSLVPSDRKLIRLIKNNNHYFFCIDEEGILQWDEEYKLKIRYGQESLNLCDVLFLLNKKQEKLLKNNYNLKKSNKLHTIGYPRIEYLELLKKYKEQNYISNEIKKKFKKFVFLPTSFPSNHLMGFGGLLRSYEEAIEKKFNRKQELFFKGIYKNIEIMEKKYNELFHYLFSNLKNVNFVIKPHPTENFLTWKKEYKKYDNVFIDSEYPSIYYLVSSIITIQYGSTISAESYVLGKKCIEYNPKINRNLNKFQLKDHRKFIEIIRDKKKIKNFILKKIQFYNSEEKSYRKSDLINHKYLKLGNFPSEKIIKILNTYKDIPRTGTVNFRISFFVKKNNVYKFILWVISKTYLLNLLPQKILKGKFRVLRREFRILHANYYNYKKRKDRYVSKNRVEMIKNIFNSEFNNKIKYDICIKRIHLNNFIFINNDTL
jgi:surface carbohydrate biosynthesis protein